MLAIVDVFDRMTSTRSRRRAIDCADVLLHITEGADRQFDPEMVLCWISIFQQA
jgi:HD-GYP domain-containing protein (c-di-GMP phosphodiesterase class II)